MLHLVFSIAGFGKSYHYSIWRLIAYSMCISQFHPTHPQMKKWGRKSHNYISHYNTIGCILCITLLLLAEENGDFQIQEFYIREKKTSASFKYCTNMMSHQTYVIKNLGIMAKASIVRCDKTSVILSTYGFLICLYLFIILL